MRFHPSSRARISALAATALVSACVVAPEPPPARVFSSAAFAPPPPPFRAEPERHETFEGTRPFEAGARLRFVSFSLSAREQLRLQRCGERCETAKLVRSWNKADFDKLPAQELVLDEPGDYYLWLRQELPNGEIGAVQATAATFEREAGILRFASGTVVFVAVDGSGMPVDRPDDPVRVGSEPVQDASSELRKLESPRILEKARHGLKQDLIVQIDPGERVEALLRETAPLPGEDLSRDPATVARRATAWEAYKAALGEIKRQLLEALRASGVDLKHDFDVSASLVVSVSTEAGLRALQAAPRVTVIYENHRVVPT